MLIENCALVTVIENNTDNRNSKILGERRYFDESVKCYESWRKFYPNINIYAICPTKATLNKKEQKILEKMDVKYIEEYMSETEDFEYGFFNVPLALSWAENNLKDKIFIHTDLDMILLRELPVSLFAPVFEKKIICGKYDENAREDQRVDYDTGFTIHLRNTYFYKQFWEITKNILGNKIPKPDNILNYDIEEYAMELIDKITSFEIHPILKYQVGEGYPSIDTFSDKDLEGLYFWHEHIINKEKDYLIKEKIKTYKRLRKI